MNLSRSFIIVSLLQEWSSTLTINKQKAWVEEERPLQPLKWQSTNFVISKDYAKKLGIKGFKILQNRHGETEL